MLKAVILCQYVPRIIRFYPLSNDVKRTSGILTETAEAGAALNLFLYMLASHIIGAIWYLYSIERQDSCWREECKKDQTQTECKLDRLYCQKNQSNAVFLNNSCPFIDPDDIKGHEFNFGISIDALRTRVVEERGFTKKFFYCFWWGLRNLSSLGQNLKTSTFVAEIFFAFFISISGLVLFALLIGNMQKYLQSKTVRVEEMRVRRRDAEQWMSHRMLPENLKDRIRRYEQYKWQETRGVEEDTLVRNLPKDLRRDIKHHLCWDLLKKMVHNGSYCGDNTFRLHSVQWRTWAARFVQAAWRRYCKKKLAKSLREEEDRFQDALATETSSTSLGATIYASKFAANLLRPLRQSGGRSTRLTQRLPPLIIPQKPAEPDFTARDF
ncbi:hypothetical protein Pint_00580 [Pistacia integerrima]|uniref:Uncharacterized protein n=1 Tax=Pistacia integerrima TaxID=434235 RepID=A0ACC0ZQL4_9ROSI|nr:hypothetical protein Pint_00580 [Pistacia integerrima]